jgi:hypothetical protein
MTPIMPAPHVLELGARDEARYVLARCRARDRVEIEATIDYGVAAASIVEMLPLAVLSKILLHRGAPTALVMFHELTPSALAVSMIATDDWPHVAMSAVKWGLRHAKPFLLARGYRRAECRAIDGHTDAIDFLRFLGFQIEARVPEFGRNGETFIQLAWRLSDHMPHTKTRRIETEA